MQFEVSTSTATAVLDITDAVANRLPDAVDSGIVTVFVPHTTAGVVINEPEDRLLGDIEAALERLVPPETDYRHDEVDDNAAAHLRSILLGGSVTVPLVDGRLALGTWQSILFVESDGPRTRRVHVTAIAD